MSDYSDFQEEASPEQLVQLKNLCAEADKADRLVDKLEADLEAAKKQKRELTENLIPQLMQDIHLKQIVTDTGLVVKLKEEVRASFPSRDKNPEKREAAFNWLVQNNHDAIIKHKVEFKFEKGQRGDADKLVAAFRELGIQSSMKRDDDVHHMTLVAFLKEQLKNGESPPLEMFGAYVQKYVKIERTE